MNQCESPNESTTTHPGIRCAGCFEHENSVKCEAEPHWTVLYQYVLGFPWSSDSTRWSMHSLKKNLLEWRWIWTISFGIMWSLANSFSINQLGLWWPISKSSWRIWILRGCRIQTQIDPQSSDESIVSINVWSFVISIFQCFVAGIHSCWASPQAKVLSAENQALVIVASHCILTSELERFCETNLAHGSAKLVENIFVKRPYLGKRGKCCAKASAKAVHLVPIYLTILGESQKQIPSCSPRCDKGSPQLSANWLPGTRCSINHGQNQNFAKTNPDCWLNQETLHVDWSNHSVVYGLTIFNPFSTSGIPDFQRTTIQKFRAEAAHILPEAFDLHPNLLHLLETKFRTEKPRNRETISTEGLATSQGRSIKSAQRNIQTVEETLVLPALVLQIKRNGFPHVSWENPKASISSSVLLHSIIPNRSFLFNKPHI